MSPPNPRPQTKPRPRQQPQTLGPVADLEHHLPPDWWNSLFNATYLKTDGDVVEDDACTRQEVDRLIEVTGLTPDQRVLDLCCGQGRHTLELARRGFQNLTGVDRSRYLIRLGRKRAANRGLSVAFRQGDARTARLKEDSFDCIAILGNSFGYFDSADEDRRVLESTARWLRPGGTLVLDIADGPWQRENFERRSWEWVDEQQFVCRERSLSGDGSRLISREVVVDAERGVIADQFYAERLYSQDQLFALLTECGFTDLCCHGADERGGLLSQDPGMMARRLLITARVAKRIQLKPQRRVPFPEVTVLLGDPRLSDAVKLDGKFGADDLATIAKLKTALEGLSDYRFHYLDDHGQLLAGLQAAPPDFVLNLCDEGFHNAATLELHVPAYLEMLGVPYSGAGPTCLGLCYDKSLVSAIATSLDVPVPLETHIAWRDVGGTIPSVLPALLKPSTGDSSIGISEGSVVRTPAQAVAYLAQLRKQLPERDTLVQEYLTGTEYSVALIGNPELGLTALPILEVDYSGLPAGLPPILSYASKWDPTSPYWTALHFSETRAPEDLQRTMTEHAIRLFERLGCRDYARFDFRADERGVPKLLEVNPNPGWCWDGKLNLMAGFMRLEYRDLLRMILEAAQQRCRTLPDLHHRPDARLS